ncbi:hypothetical protein [Sphingopyxis sp. BSNA05]|uniref:hypothetical protein n=1 Tax=Sphingopyxis sp. BSNA05 TaxID=1236614 RepID=UPI0020B8A0F2|nr:hypothetical protein [Sphingopyxis sp. BSNA05]
MTASETNEKPGWRKVIASLGNRKTLFMTIFGFAAGLPYALLLGTLYAWLSDAEVDLETMGVFSLIGLAYAFKFLWSPALDRIDVPLLKSWESASNGSLRRNYCSVRFWLFSRC